MAIRRFGYWIGLSLLLSLPMLHPSQRDSLASSSAFADGWTSEANGDEILVIERNPQQPNQVWVGSEGGGLIVWDRNGSSFSQHLFPHPDGPAGNRVRDIAFDAQGGAWLATDSGLSHVLAEKWQHFHVGDGLPSEDITAVGVDHEGGVWAGTARDGLARLAPGESQFAHIPSLAFDPDHLRDNDGPGDPRVKDLAIGPDGQVWVAHGAGGSLERPALSHFRFSTGLWEHVTASGPGQGSIIRPQSDQIVGLDVDPRTGDLWVATWGRGVLVRYEPSGAWARFALSSCPYVRSVEVGGSAVWAACGDVLRGRAVARWDQNAWTMLDLTDQPTGEVRAIQELEGEVWLGSNGPKDLASGILRFETSVLMEPIGEALSTAPTTPQSNDLTAIVFQPDGTLWAGTRGAGLLRRDARSGQWTRYTRSSTTGRLAGDTITSLVFSDMTLYAATTKTRFGGRSFIDGGLSRLDVFSGNWLPPLTRSNSQLPDNELSSLAVGQDGRVWIGIGAAVGGPAAGDVTHAGNGIAVFDPLDESWEVHAYDRPVSAPAGATTMDIAIGSDGAVWAASSYHRATEGFFTLGGGVSRFLTPDWQTWKNGEAGLEGWRDSNGGSSIGISGDFRAVAAVDANEAWAGTWSLLDGTVIERWPEVDATLNRFDGVAWTSTTFPLAGWISAILIDADARVWAGATRGHEREEPLPTDIGRRDFSAGLFVRQGNEFLALTPWNSGLASGAITALAQHPTDGSIWVASENSGLSRYLAPAPTPTPTECADCPTETATLSATATLSPTISASISATPSLGATATPTAPTNPSPVIPPPVTATRPASPTANVPATAVVVTASPSAIPAETQAPISSETPAIEATPTSVSASPTADHSPSRTPDVGGTNGSWFLHLPRLDLRRSRAGTQIR